MIKFFTIVMLFAQLSGAQSLPKNDLNDRNKKIVAMFGLTEQEASDSISRVRSSFPDFRYSLIWSDDVPANAYNFLGRLIIVTKKLAEAPGMFTDALDLILLHEVGHSLGGSPRYPDGLSCEDNSDAWAASEGLIQLWGRPEGKKKKAAFWRRGQKAINFASIWLSLAEMNIETLSTRLNIITYSNTHHESSECGHKTAEFRKSNMLEALRMKLQSL
jgi:hypothetical protein